MPDVIELAEQYSAALDRRDIAAMNRIIKAYASIQDRLQDKIDALVLEIGASEPNAAQVAKMARFKSLIEQAQGELTDFQGYLKTELAKDANTAIAAGSVDAAHLVGATVTNEATILAGFNRLPTKTIEKLLGFLSPDGPLYARINVLAPSTADLVRQKIVDGVALGYNPKKIARQIQNGFGQGLTDAMRMTRTAQLYSYREASRATYVANSDVVKGWYWFAHLGDGRVCLSCVSNHGKLFSNDVTLNDHYNGRCSAIPAVIGFDKPFDAMGEDWFSNLSESEQRAMMGKEKYNAWRGGAFSFGDLTRETPDDVYGKMRGETPLWELLGAEPPKKPGGKT